MQAKRHSSVAAGNIATQVGILPAGQPPLEAAPTPQGYAQRQSMGHNQSQSLGSGLVEATGGGINHGQSQSLIDQSRARNADMDGGADDARGIPEQLTINLSQVGCRGRGGLDGIGNCNDPRRAKFPHFVRNPFEMKPAISCSCSNKVR